MSHTWDPNTYSKFLDLRTRPARDLLAAIPESLNPTLIYDLGCGPGNSTIILKNRWPEAQVVGTDSSIDMLETARKTYPEIEFLENNIENFEPNTKNQKIDLLFANASLQWVDNHEKLFPKLLSYINKNGMFGFQMPNNFNAPSHQVSATVLQNNPDWRDILKTLRFGKLNEPLYKLNNYYDLLIKSGAKDLQLWETEYFQEMDNYAAIFEWVKGTGARPILSAMDAANQAKFTEAYIKAISTEYPTQSNGKILLPFKRLFMVGQI
jgi:trans-aconitate 2-methyltransferase